MRKLKDCNVDYIGEIPVNWDIKMSKFIFNIFTGATPRSNIEEYWNGDITWITPADFKTEDVFIFKGKKNITEKGYSSCSTTLVPNNSIIFSKRAPIGTVAISGRELCVNQGCLSCVCKNGFFYKFYYYVINAINELYNSLGEGTTFLEISYDSFKKVKLPVPPLIEQKVIADYLDTRCTKIDKAIEKRKAIIEKLKEYRTAIITQAVIKGLNSDVEMKDSGIEWIGKIPKNWSIIRLKYVSKLFGRIGFRGYTKEDIVNPQEGAVSLSPSNISKLVVDYNKCTWISWSKYYESPEIIVNSGDILCVKTGSSYGKSAIIKQLEEKSTINPQLVIINNISCNNMYLLYYMQTNCFKYQIEQSVVGGAIPTIAQDKIRNFKLPLPSNFEQQAIADYLNYQCAKIDEGISRQEQAITKLEEYRKSLIYYAVTGKIDCTGKFNK